MSARRRLNIKIVLGSHLLTFGVFAVQPVTANDFTAEKVMKHMDDKQRYAYMAGVVEGLAIARYMKDGKQKAGMECIYDWFYGDKTTVNTSYAAFEKYPAYPPGSIVDVLAKRKCGE